MFSKAYVEITNVCNLRCSFCQGTSRKPGKMSVEEFALVTDKLIGHTKYVYFHLLGEPLIHPQLGELLHIAAEKGFHCCITTNGTLLKEKADILLGAERLHKISVSLHSYEDNAGAEGLRSYLANVLDVCIPLAGKGTICALRLWNEGGKESLNDEICAFLREKLGDTWTENRNGSRKLGENLYLENAAKFEWPDVNAAEREVQFCYGLRDQIAVLCDGTVVPCCLDADGELALGNIFEQSLDDILNGERAKAIYEGFSKRRPTEALCLKCGYATRFNK